LGEEDKKFPKPNIFLKNLKFILFKDIQQAEEVSGRIKQEPQLIKMVI